MELHSPKFMGSASESGAELFKVEYFERQAYLAQSPQFYKQMAMAAGFGKVFEVGPVFRANPSFTSRHDTEFTSVDVEISWIDSHEDVMAFEERWLAHVLAVVKDIHGEQISSTFATELTVPTVPFPRVSLEHAKEMLREAGHDAPGVGHDLDPPSERALSALIKERDGHEFAFVTDYPTSVRPFYHMRHADQPTRDGLPPLFTDHQFEALGAPRNAVLAVNADPGFFDLGICGPYRRDMAADTQYCGLFMTPTLRNAATRHAFFHNGVFPTLKQALDFYDFRDTEPQRIYPRGADGTVEKFNDLPAAYRVNVDVADPPFDRKAGDPPTMTEADEDDIIAFLNTLVDGYSGK